MDSVGLERLPEVDEEIYDDEIDERSHLRLGGRDRLRGGSRGTS